MDLILRCPRATTVRVAILLSAALTLAAGGLAPSGARVDDHAVALAPAFDRDSASRDTERGLRFQPKAAATVTALRYFRVRGDTGRHVARLWSDSGARLAWLALPPSNRTGWQKVRLREAVRVSAGSTYVASFSVRADVPFAVQASGAHSTSRYAVVGGARGLRGAYPAKAMQRARFMVRPVLGGAVAKPAPSSFPDASNTGVPDGVRLAAYTGSGVIRGAGTVIDGKQVDGTLTIQAEGVVIKRSFVDGNIAVEEGGSVTISDTTVDGGTFDGSAIGQHDLTMRRVEVVGARQSVSCNGGCDVQDSWLHAQYMEPGSDWHGDGFVSNGGSGMVVRHNTLACESQTSGNGGCSGSVALFADFDPITDVTIDGNLFTASPAAYCLYGGYDPGKPYGSNPSNVVITNNVFQRGSNRKCAAFGAAAAVARSGAGNVFEGNVWDDGRTVRRP